MEYTYSTSALSIMCVVSTLSVGFIFKYNADVFLRGVSKQKRRALRNADECDVPANDWPCPGPKGTAGAEGVISFCEDRFDENFFYKCNCLPGYVAVWPVPNGQVMLDDAMVPSLAPSLAPSTEASTVVCSRGCEAPRDVCLADESLLLGDGKYKCTCLFPYVRALNGDGCRKLTTDDLIEDGACDVCGSNALCTMHDFDSFAPELSVSCFVLPVMMEVPTPPVFYLDKVQQFRQLLCCQPLLHLLPQLLSQCQFPQEMQPDFSFLGPLLVQVKKRTNS